MNTLPSSIPYPLMLSPAPTPISSPKIYTPPTPSSAGSQVNIEKWKEIARKLAFHSELRTIWNQLKITGRFLTNEQFISHLLSYEADRQGIRYYDEILCKNERQPDEHNDDTLLDVECCSPISPSSEPNELLQGPDEVGIPSSSREVSKKASVNPEPDDKTDASMQDASYKNRQIELYQQPDSSTQHCVLTVLDSQMLHSPDETGELLV